MSDNVQNCPYVMGLMFNNNLIQKTSDSQESTNETHGVEDKFMFDAVFRSPGVPLELPSNNPAEETRSSSDAELSDTESAHQAMSLSSPEDGPHPEGDIENDTGLKCKEETDGWQSLSGDTSIRHSTSTPESEEDDEENAVGDHSDEKLVQPGERASSSSEGSDYSDYVTSCSLIGPVRHDVRKAERLILGLMSNAKPTRTPEESDEQYARRVRKHNYLNMAQEFAARNRMPSGCNSDAQNVGLDCERGPSCQVMPQCEEQQDATTVSTGESQEWAKNLKNSVKCVPGEVWQSAATTVHCRPCTFETLSLKDSPNLLLPVNSLIGTPSLNQNAIHRHHQRSLAEYDACLARERGRPLELLVTSPRQGCPSAPKKLPPRSQSESSSEPANKVRNRYSDLPANVAKMARCVPFINAVRHESAESVPKKEARKSAPPIVRKDEAPANLGKRCHVRDGRLLSHEKQGSYRHTTVSSPPHEVLGGFDVYNIETTMPTIDWIAMEEHLTKAAKEEMIFRKQHRNNREEIRRKLAMGSDADDYYGGERTGRKPSLQSRLQSGMNLQICFMNETVSDQESIHNEADTEATVNATVEGLTITTTTTSEKKGEFVSIPEAEVPLNTIETVSKVPVDEATDMISKQAKLQAEARLALAQAKQMAHMQMEVEKQRKKKSPIAEMVGIQFPDGRHKVSRHALSEMNVAQLQVIVNDLHTQIENLNEELVRLLLERDDLHMEQDSMLVDIEDLTRYL